MLSTENGELLGVENPHIWFQYCGSKETVRLCVRGFPPRADSTPPAAPRNQHPFAPRQPQQSLSARTWTRRFAQSSPAPRAEGDPSEAVLCLEVSCAIKLGSPVGVKPHRPGLHIRMFCVLFLRAKRAPISKYSVFTKKKFMHMIKILAFHKSRA